MNRFSSKTSYRSILLPLLLLVTNLASAQQLEPRFFSNSPVGLNAVAVGFTRSGGNVLLVPSLGGNTLDQKSIYTIQAHAIRLFQPGLWWSFDFGYGRGGEWEVGGAPSGNTQRNYRFGSTFALPLGGGHSIKAVFATGLARGFGSDFDAVAAVYQYTWIRNRAPTTGTIFPRTESWEAKRPLDDTSKVSQPWRGVRERGYEEFF